MSYQDFIFYSQTEKGKRYNNEDALTTIKVGDNTWLFAVADGMGVNDGGEVASSVSLYMMEKRLKHLVARGDVHGKSLKKIMASLFDAADNAINQFTELHPELKGMGTTLTALLIHEDKYVWGHVGDTRLYMIKDEHITRLTRDHTIAEDSPGPTQDQSLVLPSHQSSELTRKIDGNPCQPDIYPMHKDWCEVEPNTTWLLCSDGLLVDRRKDFKELFQNFKFDVDSIHCAATAMVKKALKNGSTDNISVVTVTAVNKVNPENNP
jgi:PPM family protein phosphatase